MILVIDNYDSFVHNLARYAQQLSDAEVVVVRNDQLDNIPIPKAVIISPGPCGPTQAGDSLKFVSRNKELLPMLGVCLGHQIIIRACGGVIAQSDNPRHGKASLVTHSGGKLFANVPSPFSVGRYHSLIARTDKFPDDLTVTARTDDGVIMSFEHPLLPLFGVQFHPESVLTEHGYQILHNFLFMAGLAKETTEFSGERPVFA